MGHPVYDNKLKLKSTKKQIQGVQQQNAPKITKDLNILVGKR